ncbi:unnamed protein product [Trichogramma brassicae]|uniref:Uncharacterized protein n=1 Tax=Trichogramma brassicae TaxID=86971 RepID=A0A6H5I8A7_9HYME|nr:unnamed protein product [Trichogramma brassicae]
MSASKSAAGQSEVGQESDGARVPPGSENMNNIAQNQAKSSRVKKGATVRRAKVKSKLSADADMDDNEADSDHNGNTDGSAVVKNKVHIGRAKEVPKEARKTVTPYFRRGFLNTYPLRAYRIADALRRMFGPYNFVTPISLNQLTKDDLKVIGHAYARRLPLPSRPDQSCIRFEAPAILDDIDQNHRVRSVLKRIVHRQENFQALILIIFSGESIMDD